MKFTEFFKQSNEREIAERLRAAAKITLDDSSRAHMRAFLSEYARVRPIRTQATARAPRNQFLAFLTTHVHPMPAIAAVLIVVVSGGTVTAAETSLPGDLLYPIKVHVTEEVRSTLAVTPKARADWALSRAERRLEEAATLALAGGLNDETRAEIDSNLDAHVRGAEEDRKQLEDDDLEDAADVATNIRAVLLARANILGGIRPTMLAAKAVAQMESTDATSLTMSMSAAPEAASSIAVEEERNSPETISRGNRAAAKARIEATKKFLNRSGKRIAPEAQATAHERLKAASDALSSGEESIKRGKEPEAFDDFSKALQAAIETQDFVSEHLDNEEDSQNEKRREEKSSDSNGSGGSSGSRDESDPEKSSEHDD